MSDMLNKTPWHLWVVGLLALIWNAYPAYDFVMTMMHGANYMGNLPPEQVAYFDATPNWAKAFWAAGGWGGAIGALLLLLRSKWAHYAFIVSLIGVAGSVAYTYGMSEGGRISGTNGMILWAVISVVAGFLALYSRALVRKGVLR